MKRNNLIKVLVSGAVLVALFATTIPVFAAPADITESFVTNLQATGNQAELASLQQVTLTEADITSLQASGVTALNELQSAPPEGFYGFRAVTGSSMVNEPYISWLVSTGQPTDTLGN